MTKMNKCEQCQAPTARRFCCKRCWYDYKSAQPSIAKRVPCRICGGPTESFGTKRSLAYGLVRCNSDACQDASRKMKNSAIAKTHTNAYATGARQKARHTWEKVKRVSPAEELLAPYLSGQGWTSQFKFLTKLPNGAFPRCLWLDFSIPRLRLCIEIDGSIHRLRRDRDARRDAILSSYGWSTLRVPATLVYSDLYMAQKMIEGWLTQLTIDEKK